MRHPTTISQLTKIRPEGHNLTTSFRGKFAQETTGQIQQWPELTFMSVLWPPWQNSQCANARQNVRT
jgi:hypothetical protein